MVVLNCVVCGADQNASCGHDIAISTAVVSLDGITKYQCEYETLEVKLRVLSCKTGLMLILMNCFQD
jgi:hypothetical protein